MDEEIKNPKEKIPSSEVEGSSGFEEKKGLVEETVKNNYFEGEGLNKEILEQAKEIKNDSSREEIIQEVNETKEELAEACLEFHDESEKADKTPSEETVADSLDNSQESEEGEFTEEEAKQFVKSVEEIMAVFFGGEIPAGEAERSAEAQELFEKYGAAGTEDGKDAVFAEILQEVAKALNWDNLSEKQKEQVEAAMNEVIAEKLAEEEKKDENQEDNRGSSKTEDQEKLDREAFEKMTAEAKAKYIENLDLGEGYMQEDLIEKQKILEKELGINEEKEESDLEDIKNELKGMAEEAAEILEKDNPEKFKEFLESTKKKTDDKSKYLKYFYLQKIDSQNSGISREQYASLISNIKKLDEVSEMLAKMIEEAAAGKLEIVVDSVTGEKRLSPEAKRKLGKFIKIFLAVAGVLGSVIILGKKLEEWAAANKMAGIAGKGVIATGTMTSALKLGMVLPAVGFAGKLVGSAAILKFLLDEEKRDNLMAWLTGCKVPFKSKKSASKPEGGK